MINLRESIKGFALVTAILLAMVGLSVWLVGWVHVSSAADAPKPTIRLAAPIQGDAARKLAILRFHMVDAKDRKAAMVQQAEQQGDEEIKATANEYLKGIREAQAAEGVAGDCKPSSELTWIKNDGTPCMVAVKEEKKGAAK